jgi:alkylation response protein AidB-like acyl-CoA dehydrogenase
MSVDDDVLRDLSATVRGWLADACGPDVIRAALGDNGPDAAWRMPLWKGAVELGLPGLALPEHIGGAGAGLSELGIVVEEMGRVLFPGPFLASVVLAGTAVRLTGDSEAACELLTSLASGKETAALVSGRDPDATRLTAFRGDGRWLLDGVAPVVLDAQTATSFVCVARAPEGLGLFEVRAAQVTPRTSMDFTHPLSSVTLSQAPARLLAAPGSETAARLWAAYHVACLLLAAEQLGGAQRALDLTVDYCKTRHQFGRAIGSFQAVKHRCADMLVKVELARSVVQQGLREAQNALAGSYDDDRLALAAAFARSCASDAFLYAGKTCVQLHGGIGFTWEHDAHLYLKRARVTQLLLGTPMQARARMLPLVLADVSRSRTEPLDDWRVPEVEEFLATYPVGGIPDRELRERRFDSGLAVVHFEPGYGGRGWSVGRQDDVEAAFLAAGAEDWAARNIIGIGMVLPVVHTHGTREQKERFLKPCFTGQEIWCQLFSEPGAGSDLAGLSTQAVRDGDEFVITGQKVWTSLGHVADFGILLARTDPTVPKHKGLTFFLLDMRLPGIAVRPLRQLTGDAEFNEVHLDGVRVPASAVLGDVGEGWGVAMTTLMNERVAIGANRTPRHGGPIGQAITAYADALERGDAGPAEAERLMLLWSAAEAGRLTNLRAAADRSAPGPEGAVAKLHMAETNQAIYDYCVELAGSDGMLVEDYDEHRGDVSGVFGGSDVRHAWLRSLANSIEGGTSEVLRNVLGERVLGLPQEPRVDRDVPWNRSRRG